MAQPLVVWFTSLQRLFGISGIIAASALAFNLVKYLGAAYLIYLGIKTIISRENLPNKEVQTKGRKRVFLQGITVEALNPKTALFFLAFIPQFIDPAGNAFFQILLLGSPFFSTPVQPFS